MSFPFAIEIFSQKLKLLAAIKEPMEKEIKTIIPIENPSPIRVKILVVHPSARTIPIPNRKAPKATCIPTGLILPGTKSPALKTLNCIIEKPIVAKVIANIADLVWSVPPTNIGSLRAAVKQKPDLCNMKPIIIPSIQIIGSFELSLPNKKPMKIRRIINPSPK